MHIEFFFIMCQVHSKIIFFKQQNNFITHLISTCEISLEMHFLNQIYLIIFSPILSKWLCKFLIIQTINNKQKNRLFSRKFCNFYPFD